MQIALNGVHKAFRSQGGTVRALDGIDLDVDKFEFVALVGPSGCGKSTILNLAAGLMRPTRGHVLYDDAEVREVNTRVGYVTQRDNLLPWRTALQNVTLPLQIRGASSAEHKTRALEILHQLGLEGFEKHYPSQLSGGMRKRVALARTLVYEPETILMDEPFGALDAQLRMVLQQQLLDLLEARPKTVIFVTHDLLEAVLLADRIAIFSARPGRIIAIEDVSTPRPRDLQATRFSSEVNDLEAKLWRILAPEVSTAGAVS